MPKKPDSGKHEAAQMEQAYQSISGNKKKKKKRISRANRRMVNVIIALSVTLVLCLGFLAGCYIFTGNIGPITLSENITIDGVSVGGMTREEAEVVVSQAVQDHFGNKDFDVTVGEHTVTIPAADVGISVDTQRLLDEVFTQETLDGIPAQTAYTFVPYMQVNKVTIRSAITAFDAYYPTTVTEHVWEVVEGAPLTETPEGEEPPREKQLTLSITVGDSAFALDLDAMTDAIAANVLKEIYTYETECAIVQPKELDLEAIFTQYCTQAVDAVMDPETFEVSDHVYGYAFDLDAAKAAMQTAAPGDLLEFPFMTIAPQVTKEALSGTLFQDVLSSYTARASSSYNRDTNLRLSCEAVNGYILNPGDVFDYNKTLGQRTTAKGYKPAGTYVNGETVDTVGGGICQTSSSIYYCALMADLEIVQRACHAYVSSYVPFGMDATVDWNGPNFRFKNNTKYPIKIEAKASGGNVTIRLLGTDDKDYYVKMTYEVVDTYKWETVYVEMEKDNEKGYTDGKVLTSPYTGHKALTYRCKYSKATNQLISKEFEATSNYGKRDKRVVKIIDETDPSETTTQPTEPSETTTQPTEPSETTTQPTETTTQPTEPSETTTQPTEPSESTTQPTEPSENTTQPTDPSTDPTDGEGTDE